MNEKELKQMIISKFGSVSAFAKQIDLPTSTVSSILDRGILNANLKNVFSICKALGIKPEALDTGYDFSVSTNVFSGNNNIQVSNNKGSVTYNNTMNTIEETNPAEANTDDVIGFQITNEEVQAEILVLLKEILVFNKETLIVNKAILEELKKR